MSGLDEERVVVPVLVAKLENGHVIEGPAAQELLTYVQDFGWPGTIEDTPQFAYRLEYRPIETIAADPKRTPVPRFGLQTLEGSEPYRPTRADVDAMVAYGDTEE